MCDYFNERLCCANLYFFDPYAGQLAYLDDKNFVTGLMVVYVRNSAEESALYTTPIKIQLDHF